MKDIEISDWWINGVIKVIELYRSGILQLSSAVEEVTEGNQYHFPSSPRTIPMFLVDTRIRHIVNEE
jgi:hypothetical protein